MLLFNTDSENYNTPETLQQKRCIYHKDLWIILAQNPEEKRISERAVIYPTITRILNDLNKETNYAILTTGSLHLVGSMLSILDPELTGKDTQ